MKTHLCTHEVRIIKVSQSTVLELIGFVLGKIGHKKFDLHNNQSGKCAAKIDWYFDSTRCEAILFSHSVEYRVNHEKLQKCIANLHVQPIDSLLINMHGYPMYTSIHNDTVVTPKKVKEHKHFFGSGKSTIRKLRNMLFLRCKPLTGNELRVIRLSKKAIQELLWEYLMENGKKIMDISEDSDSIIFSMNVIGNIEEVDIYAMNLEDVTNSMIELIDARCNQLCYTAVSLIYNERTHQNQYVSVTID